MSTLSLSMIKRNINPTRVTLQAEHNELRELKESLIQIEICINRSIRFEENDVTVRFC